MLGVRDADGEPVLEGVAETLAGTGALLFLDNFEHLTAAAGYISTLLHRAPDLDLLITSRAPPRLLQRRVTLRPLSVYDASTSSPAAAALGGCCTRTCCPRYGICRRLDGLSLAIGLVAARLAVLPPPQLLLALDEGSARHGGSGRPPRPAAHAARDDRLELQPLEREPTGAAPRAPAVFAGGCPSATRAIGFRRFLSPGAVTGSLLRGVVPRAACG